MCARRPAPQLTPDVPAARLLNWTLVLLTASSFGCAGSTPASQIGVTMDSEPAAEESSSEAEASAASEQAGAEPRLPISAAGETHSKLGSSRSPRSEVVRDGDYLRVPGNIVFETGRAELKQSGPTPEVLRQLQRYLEAHREVTLLRVEGHTDSRGSDERNLELSGERALSVKTWLVNHGIDSERLVAVGFGSDQPIADDTTALGRAQNRRTEFRIVQYADQSRPENPAGEGTVFE